MDEKALGLYFQVFNEIGIISQLSRSHLDASLPDGLIEPHFAVINHLIRVKDGRTPLELARAFQVPKTSMTHTLMGLEKHKLVEVRPNPEDKRSKQVWLLQAGRTMRDATIAGMGPRFEGLANEIPPDRIAEIVPVLRELREFLDNNRNS